MARKKPQLNRVRYTIVGFVVILVVALLGIGVFYSTDPSTDEYREGEHYRVVDTTSPDLPLRDSKGRIPVTEYFSYGCIHCRNFDPLVENWRATLADDVKFERSPVAFSPLWSLLAQAYFSLDSLNALEQNHPRFFHAIHDQGIQFLSLEMIADFVDGHDVTREEFLRSSRSPRVRRAVALAEQRARELAISGVPTLVVANRYVILNEVGRKNSLAVADFLINRERGAKGATE